MGIGAIKNGRDIQQALEIHLLSLLLLQGTITFGWLYMVKDETSTLGEQLYSRNDNFHHPFGPKGHGNLLPIFIKDYSLASACSYVNSHVMIHTDII